MKVRLVNISDVCKTIFAGGDAPKGQISQIQTEEYPVPIYSNGEDNQGLYGFTNIAKVTEPSITVSARGTIGYAAIRNKPFFPIVRLITLVPKLDDIDIKYLYYAIQNYKFTGTGTSIPQLTVPMLKQYAFPLPDKSLQVDIVCILDKVSDLISLRKQQLSKLDEMVKSRFIELFGDTILNPFGWEKDILGAVCDVRDGTHDSPQYYDTGYPLVTSKNVTGGKIDLTDCSLICEADFKRINERSKVDVGDIIMPMIGTVGKPVIVDIEPVFAIKNVALIKFKTNSKVLNIYIRALLQSDYFDDAVSSKVRGGTQKFISLGDIRKLSVLVPPIDLQNQFAAFVEQTDKSKLAVQQSLDKLETLKKALMQKYFG